MNQGLVCFDESSPLEIEQARAAHKAICDIFNSIKYRFVGVELDSAYYKQAVKRMESEANDEQSDS